MNIDRELIEHLARLSRLSLTEDEVATYREQMAGILELVDRLDEVDTAQVPETAHVHDVNNVLRADEVHPSRAIEEVLENAPFRKDRAFLVPRVIE